MLITVQSANKKDNGYVSLAGTLAVMEVLKTHKKTLVLQFTNASKKNVETVLLGQEIKSLIAEENTAISNEGMDNLINTAENGKLTADEFKSYCRDVIVSHDDTLLAVAKVSTKATFLNELEKREDSVKSLVENAKEMYENVIVTVSNDNVEIKELLNNMADLSLFCVSQGDTKATLMGKNPKVVITKYDSDSVFDIKTVAKNLDVKRSDVYKIERTTAYIDAILKQDVASFIKANKSNEQGDVNYLWYEDTIKVVSLWCPDLASDAKEDIHDSLEFVSYLDNEDEEDIDEEDLKDVASVKVENVEVKKGLFKKEIVEKVVLSTSEETETDIEEDDEEPDADMEDENDGNDGDTDYEFNKETRVFAETIGE